MRAGLLFLLIFCLAWPAGILKLSVIKNYLFFIYFTMYRSRAYGSDPVWQVWLGRFLASPVEYALALVGVVWVGARLLRGRVERWSLPFLAYTVLMAGTTLRNRSTSPRYVSSLVPPLHVLAGLAVARMGGQSTTRRMAVGVAVLTAALASYSLNPPPAGRGRSISPADRLVEYYRHHAVGDGAVVIPMLLLPTMHYYVPEIRFIPQSADGDRQLDAADLARPDVRDIVLDAIPGREDLDVELHRRGWSRIATLGSSDGPESIWIYSKPAGHPTRR